jgi:hypothetical protein
VLHKGSTDQNARIAQSEEMLFVQNRMLQAALLFSRFRGGVRRMTLDKGAELSEEMRLNELAYDEAAGREVVS